eukprot:scaffold2429_cov165-Amphora_coffeaeformis.AAC.15
MVDRLRLAAFSTWNRSRRSIYSIGNPRFNVGCIRLQKTSLQSDNGPGCCCSHCGILFPSFGLLLGDVSAFVVSLLKADVGTFFAYLGSRTITSHCMEEELVWYGSTGTHGDLWLVEFIRRIVMIVP